MHLCDLLETQLDDPRLEGITITRVKVAPDTTRAEIYFSVLGDQEARQTAQEGLESAAGRLRREIGARTRLRNTPALIFHWDPSLEYSERIDQLLDQLGLGQEDSDPEGQVEDTSGETT
jgi:ribosome-binding factor A